MNGHKGERSGRTTQLGSAVAGLRRTIPMTRASALAKRAHSYSVEKAAEAGGGRSFFDRMNRIFSEFSPAQVAAIDLNRLRRQDRKAVRVNRPYQSIRENFARGKESETIS
jgi:hypothetical protein